MNAGRLQAALAHALVDDDVRDGLRDHVEELRRRFDLTGEEIAVLSALDQRRVELTAQVGRAKRLDFLRRGLPATLCYLQLADRHALLHDFVRASPAPVEPVATSRALSESRRFAAYLDGPDWIREIATFELAQLELVASAEATDWARRAAEAPQERSLERTTVVLGRHVRVQTFAHDVVALASERPRELPRNVRTAPTQVTLVKRTDRPLLVAYRTGTAVAAMLRLCETPRLVPDVLTAAGVDRGPEPLEAVRRAVANGVLLVVEDATCESAR